MKLAAIQQALSAAGLDGWLFYDHHHRDPIAGRILGLDPRAHVTRRWYYFIPATGAPKKLVHRIEKDKLDQGKLDQGKLDQGKLDTLPGDKTLYSSWQELAAGINGILAGAKKIAMQYSPNNAIVYVSMVDAGTVEYLRSLGKEIVSSADLVSQFEAVLTPWQVESHDRARLLIDEIVAQGWQHLRKNLDAGIHTTEYDLMQWLSAEMRAKNIIWENGPNVSVNENSSDSHYDPTEEKSSEIKNGDFLLIDIWGRLDETDVDGSGSCYYDITWTAVVGREPSAKEQEVFEIVTAARDAAISAVENAFAEGRPIHGYEGDDAARKVIVDAGYGEYFTHRTGHNIGNEIHGTGANLDNLETHDVRLILPDTCFSVEPGIYLPEFGVRSEIDMLTAPGKAWVTGKIQRELVRV